MRCDFGRVVQEEGDMSLEGQVVSKKDTIGFINPGSLMDRLPNKGSAQRATLQTNTQLMGRPNYLNDRPEGRSNLRREGLAEEERLPLLTLARLSDWKASPLTLAYLRTASPTGRPSQTPLPTSTHFSNREHAETLLIAPLRLAQSEPTRTNRPGMPAPL